MSPSAQAGLLRRALECSKLPDLCRAQLKGQGTGKGNWSWDLVLEHGSSGLVPWHLQKHTNPSSDSGPKVPASLGHGAFSGMCARGRPGRGTRLLGKD